MRVVTDYLTASIESGHEIKISTVRNPVEQIIIHPPSFHYRAKTQELKVENTFNQPRIMPSEVSSLFGKVDILHFEETYSESLGFEFQVLISHILPFVGIKVNITNHSTEPIRQENIQITSIDSFPSFITGNENLDLGCYVNGWQSWSYSGTYPARQKMIQSRLKRFQGPKLYDAASPQSNKAGAFASDQFGVLLDRTNRTGLLAGFISQKNHFGHIMMQPGKIPVIQILAAGDLTEIPAGGSINTDWLLLQFLDLNDPDPLKSYLELVAEANEVKIPDHTPVGWCSWYYYFTRISAEIIRNNLEILSEKKNDLPINLIQIDDGYQKAVGDWLTPRQRFAGQMDLLASEIKENGYQPGLWMAPFIVHPSSSIFRDHPDWILRDLNGKPINAGWNWNRFCAGLDLTNPQVQEYLRAVIRTAVHQWGYTYLKLDFLYAGALDSHRYDPTCTRAQALRLGMELIRQEAGPQTYLLGCGAPLGPMLGLVDGMRIGTDVAPDWEPRYFGLELLFPNEPDIPSAKNAMQNVLTRSMLHNRWWQNDPDCLLIRESSRLTLTEIQSMASIIALSGGLMLISDNMDEVSRYRLRIAQVLLPAIGKRPMVIDWADELHPHLTRLDLENATGCWHLLGYTNWDKRPIKRSLHLSDFRLPSSGRWILRSFWKEKVLVSEGGAFEVNVPPHGTVLLAARKFTPDVPIYAGSNLHISQGLEVSQWNYSEGHLSFDIDLPTHLSGYCELFLPFTPQITKIQSLENPIQKLTANHYRIDLQLKDRTNIQIHS